MNFFGLWSKFHQQLDPDPHSECGSGRQIECGSGSETLPQTEKKQMANLGKELIYLGDLDMMMLRRLTRRNSLQENAIIRYLFSRKTVFMRIIILQGKRNSVRKTVFALFFEENCTVHILQRKRHSSKELKNQQRDTIDKRQIMKWFKEKGWIEKEKLRRSN